MILYHFLDLIFLNIIVKFHPHKIELGDIMEFQSKKLYPIPRVQTKNSEYTKLLLQDYAGETSEDSAIHLYTFQSLILEN